MKQDRVVFSQVPGKSLVLLGAVLFAAFQPQNCLSSTRSYQRQAALYGDHLHSLGISMGLLVALMRGTHRRVPACIWKAIWAGVCTWVGQQGRLLWQAPALLYPGAHSSQDGLQPQPASSPLQQVSGHGFFTYCFFVQVFQNLLPVRTVFAVRRGENLPVCTAG